MRRDDGREGRRGGEKGMEGREERGEERRDYFTNCFYMYVGW